MYWYVRRPDTHGVKLLLHDGDRLVFVRHSYGNRNQWELPGGGLNGSETHQQAATREAREELGVKVDHWRHATTLRHTWHATANLACMLAPYDGQPLKRDQVELLELCWAPHDDPPRPLGPHAEAILALRLLDAPAPES